MPPPAFAAHSLPFNWAWHQNPHIFIEHNKNTGEMTLTNRSKAKNVNHNYIAQAAETVPHDPPPELPIKGNMLALVQELQIAMKERPIWTRRSLINRVSHLAGQNTALYNMRIALQYVGYQFRGGPWRDAVVKLGVDPRKDPKYRKYQTLTYKLFEEEEKIPGMPWSDVRQTYSIAARAEMAEAPVTHLFDGNTLTIDGKLWQLCDITDPLLVHLIENAPYRGTCDIESDGWYTNGALAKIKAIMKTKLLAIRANKELNDKDFETALSMPDIVEPQDKPSRLVHIPVPDIRLSDEEIEEMKKRGVINAIRGSGIRKRATKTSLRVQRMGEKGSLKLKKRPVRKGPVRVPRKSAMTTAIYAAIEANPERQTSTDPGTTNEGDMESAIDPNLEDADEDVEGDLEDGDGESESEVEEDEHDEGGSGDEDLESDGGERIDGYHSDATDIVDFRTLYAPQNAT
jgi:general transcription factor 3C polypeptide 5 (transcription factor C subunit 1)